SDPDFDALESNADSDLDLDAPESNVDSELEASDSNELLDDLGLGDEELRPLSSSEEKNSSHYPAGKDEDIEASSLNANERSQSLSALDDAFDIDDEEREAPALNEQDSTDLFSALDDGTFESDDESTQELSGDIPAAKAPKAKHDADELFANIENDNDIDDIETNTSSMQDSEDEQSFSSFEETNINLLAKADLETKKEFGEEFDFDSSEETKISLHLQTDKPDEKESNRTNDNTPHKQDSELPLNQIDKLMEPSFDPLLGASDLNLSDEPIFVEESTNSTADTPIRLEAIERNGGSASLTATAKANEALLRLSLCFDRTSALNIAREYLPQISSNGCLIQLGKTAEAIANWRRGAHTENKAKPSRELQTIAKTAKHGEWSKIPVDMQKEFFDTKQSLVIYKHQKSDGSILLLAGDYPAEDETLREVLSSFAQQLGQK
ncbi:MAG: hypothetical protein NTX25_12860, partial [Proteobacteria bacterium]|nr:hypothetical protein [Pseudomonadota bacterium]